jgi:hypothetical protein
MLATKIRFSFSMMTLIQRALPPHLPHGLFIFPLLQPSLQAQRHACGWGSLLQLLVPGSWPVRLVA